MWNIIFIKQAIPSANVIRSAVSIFFVNSKDPPFK